MDVSYLAHRAFHVMGHLEYQGIKTGIIYQFLKTIGQLKDEFQTDRIAFCFEHPHLFRRDVFPDYKKHRSTRLKTDEEKRAYSTLQNQIQDLHKKHLPRIGFRNIFCIDGHESDDLMAALAKNVSPYDEMILVTADSDMYQVLAPNVMIYSPQKQKLLTCEWFVKKYRIFPRQWAVVKAICGCASDEVPGIPGIGEITALSYLQGYVKEGTRAYTSINSREGKTIVRRNRALVQLPYQGCSVPALVEDKLNVDGWKEVCKTLGMKSLAGHPPIATRKLGSGLFSFCVA